MIEVKNLSKNYGKRSAIRNLNFKVGKGEVVGLLGPNGAGKSTAMKIITGFMAPSSGQVTVAGFDVFENPIDVKKRIGYLPEAPPVYHDMYVEDYLTFVARLKCVERGQISSLVKSALEKTTLSDVKGRLIGNLSKGYRQRVGLAQALVSDPEILILDEPTVGLDPKQVSEVRHLIQQLKGQHTVILSTHILSEVQAVCEKVIIINQGEIVAEDSIEILSRRMSGVSRMSVKVLRDSDDICLNVSQIDGVVSVKNLNPILDIEFDGKEATAEQISQRIVQGGAGLLEMKIESMGLEDIFIKLTSSKKGV